MVYGSGKSAECVGKNGNRKERTRLTSSISRRARENAAQQSWSRVCMYSESVRGIIYAGAGRTARIETHRHRMDPNSQSEGPEDAVPRAVVYGVTHTEKRRRRFSKVVRCGPDCSSLVTRRLQCISTGDTCGLVKHQQCLFRSSIPSYTTTPGRVASSSCFWRFATSVAPRSEISVDRLARHSG